MNRLSILLVVVSLIAGMIGCDGNGAEELIPDDNLEAVIREVIGKPTGDIYPSDLAEFNYLYAAGKHIFDITGPEYCTSLTTIDLNDNDISDILPLANLTNLEYLHLNSNQISDISPLANLTSLLNLDLVDNQIDDISPLSNLTSLKDLYLNDNQISDIVPLLENEKLGVGDKASLNDNPLSDDSINIYIPQLEARGVIVKY